MRVGSLLACVWKSSLLYRGRAGGVIYEVFFLKKKYCAGFSVACELS